MKHISRRGFTLIEIMVVISIIASLASVVLVGVRAAQASGRDSARSSNALQVRNALALYSTDHGGVPAGGSGIAGCNPEIIGGVTSYVCKGDLGAGVLKPLVDGGYISHIPVDMINTNGLEYTYVTAPATGVTPRANGGDPVEITPTATFNYVSEFESSDPVTAPVVIPTYIGDENFVLYPGGGYPSPLIVVSPVISNFTAPSTIAANVSGTWTVAVQNPLGITLTYFFDWGDSTSDLLTSSSSSFDAHHAYLASGNYTTMVTVSGSGSPVEASAQTVVTAPVNQTLSVSVGGLNDSFGYSLKGEGTVSSSPSGISCKTNCSASFANNSSITLTATPDKYSKFEGWTGACTGSAPTCTVTMDSAKSVVALIDHSWGKDMDRGTWSTGNTQCSDASYGVTYGGGTTGWRLPTGTELNDALRDQFWFANTIYFPQPFNFPFYSVPATSRTYWSSDLFVNNTRANTYYIVVNANRTSESMYIGLPFISSSYSIKCIH